MSLRRSTLQLVGEDPQSDPTLASHSGSDAPSSSEIRLLRTMQSDSDPGHFTTVGTDASATRSVVSTTVQSLPLVMLLVLVLGGGATGLWWISRPPGADELYHSIEQAAESDRLWQVESQMRDFMLRFEADPRVGEIRAWNRQVLLERRDRDFDLLARRGHDISELLPVESAYVDALRLANVNPPEALERMEAIIELYGSDERSDDDTGRRVEECLELARRKADQLSAAVADQVSRARAALDAALAEIETLVADDPAEAVGRARAVIVLYGEHAWAKEHVDRAQQVLNMAQDKQQ